MKDFFNCPKELKGWTRYRDGEVAKKILPKWRREGNLKHLEEIFEFADIICNEMRIYTEK